MKKCVKKQMERPHHNCACPRSLLPLLLWLPTAGVCLEFRWAPASIARYIVNDALLQISYMMSFIYFANTRKYFFANYRAIYPKITRSCKYRAITVFAT